ncbi:protein DBF4 homolog B isoform X4 [Sorex araneus]|uniref:protein DBF4 homolog B isoform X4 n=1 Tax=Sorex araneus TaxID=42254 RepID=UPI002433D465|nr:protein DBF4 homolog B isoform X4 [Sorex araneus]
MAEGRLRAPHPGPQVGAAGCWGKCQRRSGAAGKRPFSGKSFYLDLPAGSTLQFLTGTIQQLGGVIEGFLSKEVTYMVSSRLEAKSESRRVSPRNCPSPGEARVETPSSRAPPKGSPTRPVLRPPSSGSSCSPVSQARAWGVRILHVDEMMARVQRLPLDVLCGVRRGPRKRQGSCPAAESRTRKVARLQAPFLKVEDESRNFRPCQHQFKTFPELSFLGPKDASPFEALLFAGGSHPAREPWDAETSPRSGARRRTGYCECCQQAFEELHGHLQSARHLHFAWGAQSYAEVDGIIAQLSPGLADIRARAHLPRRPGSPPRDSHPLGSETVPHSQAPGLGATCPRMEEPDEQSAPGAQEWTQGHLQAPPEPVGTGETLALGSSCQGWACGSVGPLGSPEPSPGFVGCSSGPAPAPTGHEQRVWSPSSDTAQRLTMSPPSRLPPAPVAPGQHRANPRPFFPCTPTCACPAPRPASPCRDPSSGSPQVGGPSSGPHQPPGQEGSECPSS